MHANTALALAVTVPAVLAFPFDSPAWASAFEKRQVQGAGANPPAPPPFDAAAQYVSTTGTHKFVAPGPTDIRGMCPGLNAAANHGYLPHNGVATTQQFIDGTRAAYGMAPDLGAFLATYGSLVDGTGTGWSLLGTPHTGIGGSHNNYETDSSPLKSDLNQYGSNTRTIDSQFQTLYNMQPDAATANYNLEVLRDFRASRFNESISKNPYFLYGPFTGVAVSQAAFTFIYRFMSNKSAENPEGVLNKAVLKSFMSYSGPENNLTHTIGNERIPDQWYKRNPSDEYSIPYFVTDIDYFVQKYPFIFGIGCNKGKVNTYQSISAETLTGGAMSTSFAKANPLCLGAAYLKSQAKTELLSAAQLTSLTNIINSVGPCPAVKSFDTSQLQACPGFTVYGGPSGPVAPGAIQS